MLKSQVIQHNLYPDLCGVLLPGLRSSGAGALSLSTVAGVVSYGFKDTRESLRRLKKQ